MDIDKDVEVLEVQESIGRRATRTFFASVTGKFLSMAITTATFIIVARLLGPSNYGVYTVALGYASLIGAVSIFGIAAYFDRNISYMSYKKDIDGMARVLSNGYGIIVPISFLLMAIGILLSGFVAANYLSNSGVQVITLMIVSVDLFFSTVWGASYSALIGFGKGKNASIDLVVLGLIQLLIGIALIYAGYGVNGAVIGILLGDVFGFFATGYHTYRALNSYGKAQIKLPTKQEIWNTLKFALPLASNNFLLVGGVNFGTLFLSMYASTFVVGNYGTALKGLGMMNVVYGTLAMVLIQSFSTFISLKKDKKEIEESYNKTIVYSLLLNLPVVVFVGVFAQPIVYLFLSARFYLAPLYLSIIAIGTTLMIVNSFTSSFFIATGKVRELMNISLLAVAIEIASVVALVPSFSAVGALVGLYIIGNIATFALLVRGLRKHFEIRADFRKMLNLFVCNAILAMVLSAILLTGSNIIELALGVAAVVVLYPILLVMFKGIDKQVLAELDHLASNLPIVGRTVKQFDRYVRFFISIFDAS